jgi:glutathione peroxidase
MKNLILILMLACTLNACAQDKPTNSNIAMNTLHDFKATTIDGKEFDFSSLKGKKVMIVNTASECGLTPQYKVLQELYDQFGGEKFEIIGFPANDFGRQEPGTDNQIAEFCEKNYGVSFTMMSKISVKGKDMHPIYQWLTKKEQNGVSNADVSWNFQKFLIDENGNWVKSISPRESPAAIEVIEWLNK